MKNLILDGRLGKDCEKGVTKMGKPYIRFSLANSTFFNGETKTEWFDITCTNPKFVDNEKVIKFLTKGRYVIVSGRLRTEVRVSNNKVYCNQHVDADLIEGLGGGNSQKDKSEEEQQVSTYTGGTPSALSEKHEEPAPAPAPTPEPAPVAVSSNGGHSNIDEFNNSEVDDDLPF